MRDFKGKTALVTGGASGIGMGMAQAMLKAGAKVAICDVDLAPAKHMLGAREDVMLLNLDVADAAAWDKALDAVEARLGPVQVLFNNAGVSPPSYAFNQSVFEEQTLEEWRWALGVNLDGVFFGIRAVLGRLRKSGLEGHIVNTSSMAGLLPFPGMSPAYAATKSAVLGLSEQLRLDLHQRGPANVGVSILFPGHTQSRIAETSLAQTPTKVGAGATSDFVERVNARLASGSDPGLVGERVLSGIRRGEFYIFSHPEYAAVVERRFEGIRQAFAEPADPRRNDVMPAQIWDPI